MSGRKGLVTLQGNPMTLVGSPVESGDTAPNATVLDGDLSPVSLASFTGKIRVLLTVPSVDTSVCDAEVRRFNQEAAALGDDVVVLAVSMDLPFAQQRWCGAAGIDRVKVLSDHRDAAVGLAYGVLMEEVRLLARAVFVIDRTDRVCHSQLVREVADAPDYDAVLAAVTAAL